MQVKGENYLIPVDAHVGREDDIKRKTINARDILDKMDEAKSISISCSWMRVGTIRSPVVCAPCRGASRA